MSNDITNEQPQNPNPEVEPISSGQLVNAAGDGEGAGERWTRFCAGRIELRNIFNYARREGPRLNPYQYDDVNQAILEAVRIIFPPCGLCVNTALDYWRLIGSHRTETACTAPFVEFFLEAAVDCVFGMVEDDAYRKAEEWLRHGAEPEEIEHVEQFVDQFGDTWESEPPGPCNNVFEVVLWMAGYDPSSLYSDTVFEGPSDGALMQSLWIGGDDLGALGHAGGADVEVEVSRGVLWAFLAMIPRDDFGTPLRTNFARDTEEYATFFLRFVVSLVQEGYLRENTLTEDTPAEGDSDGAEPGASQETVVQAQMPMDRNPRHIRFRDRSRNRAERARRDNASPDAGSPPSTAPQDEESDD